MWNDEEITRIDAILSKKKPPSRQKGHLRDLEISNQDLKRPP